MPLLISPAQCRAARAVLDWAQDDLELHAGVAKRTISKFESGVGHIHPASVQMLRRALEAAGVLFLDDDGHGAGVRFAQDRGAA
jgi:transcriptional regulator with XRE-family HTH domain